MQKPSIPVLASILALAAPQVLAQVQVTPARGNTPIETLACPTSQCTVTCNMTATTPIVFANVTSAEFYKLESAWLMVRLKTSTGTPSYSLVLSTATWCVLDGMR